MTHDDIMTRIERSGEHQVPDPLAVGGAGRSLPVPKKFNVRRMTFVLATAALLAGGA